MFFFYKCNISLFNTLEIFPRRWSLHTVDLILRRNFVYNTRVNYVRHVFEKFVEILFWKVMNIFSKSIWFIFYFNFIVEYKAINKIGEGSFSEVLKCQDKVSGGLFAAKRLKKSYFKWVELEKLEDMKNYSIIN